jgi:hypothetical protein
MPAEVYPQRIPDCEAIQLANQIVLCEELHYLERLATLDMRFLDQGLVRQREIVLALSVIEMERQRGEGAWAVENGQQPPKKIPVKWNSDTSTGVDHA